MVELNVTINTGCNIRSVTINAFVAISAATYVETALIATHLMLRALVTINTGTYVNVTINA